MFDEFSHDNIVKLYYITLPNYRVRLNLTWTSLTQSDFISILGKATTPFLG